MLPLVSVIIPVYRAMPYLADCLESLLKQTIVDKMEIVCVDDCGGDESVQYITTLQQSHPKGHQIQLYSMPRNSGAAAARNYGLTKAVGDYVGFVDADDWCEKNMYRQLVDAVLQYKAQWGYCIGQKEYTDTHSEQLSQPRIANGELTSADRQRLLTHGVAYFWTGLYNRQFLINEAISFPEGKFSEDSFFWWTVLMHTSHIAAVDKVGYHYRIQNNSVSRRPDPTKAEQKQDMYCRLLGRLRSEGLYAAFAAELDYLYIKKGLLIPLLIKAINHPDTENAYYRQMIAQAAINNIDIANNKYMRRDIKARLLYRLFRANGKLTSRLLRLKYHSDPF